MNIVKNYTKTKTIGQIILLFIMIFSINFKVKAEDDLTLKISELQYTANVESDAAYIHPQLVGDKWYMFLPSQIDDNFTVSGNADTIITDSSLKEYKITDENDTAEISLEGLSVNSDSAYVFTISAPETEEKLPLYVMKSANIQTIFINNLTDLEGNKVDASWLNKDKVNNVAKSGNIIMIKQNGDITINTKLAQMKGRGNSSWTYAGEKKPYNIKLEEKKELIAGSGKAKSWCLISGGYKNNIGADRTHLTNIIAMEIYKRIGGNNALDVEPVDLYIDGEYRGIYLLTEKVQINKARVDITESEYQYEDKVDTTMVRASNIENEPYLWSYAINKKYAKNIVIDDKDEAIKSGIIAYKYATNSVPTKKGGYLLEIDFRYYSNNAYFITRHGAEFVLKEPEYASREQVQKIAIFVQKLEDAIYADSGLNAEGKHYSEIMDMDSFVKRFTLDLITGQADVMDASALFYIDVDKDGEPTGKLMSGPAWDYDLSSLTSSKLENADLYAPAAAENRKVWIEPLLKKGNIVFEIDKLSNEVVKGIWDEMNQSWIAEKIAWLNDSNIMNYILWKADMTAYNYPRDVQLIASRFAKRYTKWYDTLWNDSELKGVTIEVSGATLTANVGGTAASYQWYTVNPNNEIVLIEGANEATYDATENGRYLVSVTGNLNKKETVMYSDICVVNVFEEETTTTTQITTEPVSQTTTNEVTTTNKETTTNNITSTAVNKDSKLPGCAAIKKVFTKKKNSKKLKITIKKIVNLKGYQICIYTKMSYAKRNKKALYKKNVKIYLAKSTKKLPKNFTYTVVSKKIKNKKALYVRVRAYNVKKNGKKLFGKWSKIKRVRILNV